jgi:hypothetical protein
LRRHLFLIASAALLCQADQAVAEQVAEQPAAAITILPDSIQLVGPEARHRLLVQRVKGNELLSQVREGIVWSSSDPAVVSVDGGRLHPNGNGSAEITACIGDQVATARIVVTGMHQPHEWNFRNHIQAVLAKMGCNSGSCHGALAGKGGFKLSLRGYDTMRDFQTITRQARGRRIELSDPGRSLILAKPSGAIPHKGGLRFKVDSLDYRVVSEWIAAGAKPPTSDESRLDRLEVFPKRAILSPADEQQIIVQAHYTDGRVEDVTRWAKFDSANEAVATVDTTGSVTVVGFGEGAVTAWFASKVVFARVTAPYDNHVPAPIFANAPRRNFIDNAVLAQLQLLNLPPSPAASDAEFLRRAFVDTIGTLPTKDEVRSFLGDTASDKRDRLIESLLSRPEFVDYWAYKWSDVLLVTGERLRPQSVKAYYNWIRGHVEQNTPWDEFVRLIVTAQGSSHENGATNFYALHQDPEGMSENVAQAFLGLSIGCAKCHNHPLEKWTNQQYYAMANLFARVRAKGWGGDPRNGDGLRTVLVVDKGELTQPLTGKPQPPTPLDGTPLDFDSTEDRRVHLADWLTARDNPYFARSITNRIWANFFGVGLVEQVDDMRASNPASNEALLAAASAFLVEKDFDLKTLMRLILQSETYQLSSQPLPENAAEKRFYSRYYPRRMMAEVLLDAISQVTGIPSEFNEIAYPGADRQETDFYPKGTRALQLYDAAVNSYFLQTFGRNERAITCECERSDEPSMIQVLHISNGDTINGKLRAEGNEVDRLLTNIPRAYEMVEDVYLRSLSRYPTDREMAMLLAILNETPDDERRVVVEDLFWSVLSSREFLFNH